MEVTFTTPDTGQGYGWCSCDNRGSDIGCEGRAFAGVAGCGLGAVSVHVTRRGLTYISVPLKGLGSHSIWIVFVVFAFLVSRDGATAHDANGLDTLEPCGDLALDALAIQFKMNEMLGSLGNGDVNT